MIYSCLEFSTAIGNRGVNRGSLEGIMLGLVAEAGNGGLLTTLRFRLVLAPVNLQRIWLPKSFESQRRRPGRGVGWWDGLPTWYHSSPLKFACVFLRRNSAGKPWFPTNGSVIGALETSDKFRTAVGSGSTAFSMMFKTTSPGIAVPFSGDFRLLFPLSHSGVDMLKSILWPVNDKTMLGRQG